MDHRRRAACPLAVFLVVGAAALADPAAAQRGTACRDREPALASARTAQPDEPGERMLVIGNVLAGEDRHPVAGARVLAFHTDARGYYSEGGMDENNARLCAVLLTAENGAFRFEIIKPAHYATGGPPAHVHFEVTLPDGKSERCTVNFEGDPLLEGRKAGERWDTIRPIEKGEAGTPVVQRDLWVR